MVLACFGRDYGHICHRVRFSGLPGLSLPASGSQMSPGSGDFHLFLSFRHLFVPLPARKPPISTLGSILRQLSPRFVSDIISSSVDKEVLLLDGDSLEATILHFPFKMLIEASLRCSQSVKIDINGRLNRHEHGWIPVRALPRSGARS